MPRESTVQKKLDNDDKSGGYSNWIIFSSVSLLCVIWYVYNIIGICNSDTLPEQVKLVSTHAECGIQTHVNVSIAMCPAAHKVTGD